MARPMIQSVLMLVLVALLTLPAIHCRREEREHEMMQFEAQEPERLFESDGGSIVQWKHSTMTDTGRMEPRMVTLNERGLLFPQYANSPRLVVVLQGCARMGMMLPMGMRANVRRVQKGEVIAVPRGMPYWMFNDGKEKCRFLSVANTWTAPTMREGHNMYEVFHLAGARHEGMGGILQGFSTDMLADAFDMDEESVRKLVGSQEGTAIVKVEEQFDLPRSSHESDAVMVDFTYHLAKAHPDIVTERAGTMTIVNGYKMPALKLMHMAIGSLKLAPNALMAPGWSANADRMIFAIGGSARIQIVKPNGEMACDVEMKEGSMMMVPQSYPIMQRAGDDGLDAVAVMNSHRPIDMFMAGKTSVLRSIPREVRMASFQIDRELEGEIGEHRRRHASMLPPARREHKQPTHDEHSRGDDEETWLKASVEDMKEVIESMLM